MLADLGEAFGQMSSCPHCDSGPKRAIRENSYSSESAFIARGHRPRNDEARADADRPGTGDRADNGDRSCGTGDEVVHDRPSEARARDATGGIASVVVVVVVVVKVVVVLLLVVTGGAEQTSKALHPIAALSIRRMALLSISATKMFPTEFVPRPIRSSNWATVGAPSVLALLPFPAISVTTPAVVIFRTRYAKRSPT